MRGVVRQAIGSVYGAPEPMEYLRVCGEPFALEAALQQVFDEFDVVPKNLKPTIWPAVEWHVAWPAPPGSSFGSRVLVSKLAALFYVQHDFRASNPHPEPMTSFLAGYSGEAYIRAQFRYEQRAAEVLRADRHTQLSEAELNEVVCDLSLPAGVTLFGPQVTVERALFHDLLGWCPPDEQAAPGGGSGAAPHANNGKDANNDGTHRPSSLEHGAPGS